MRAHERRAVSALSRYLTDHNGRPAPEALVSVVAEASGATGCALTVAGRRYRWGGERGPWWERVVEYGGRLQGSFAIAPAALGPMEKVVALLGMAVETVRLTVETDVLRRDGDAALRELADDRWRAAVEMEEERRRLERDLHDGAQHHLVALKMSLALAEHAPSVRRLEDLVDRLDTAEAVLRRTAAGVLPVDLVSEGAAAALTAELGGHDDIELDLSGLRRRYPQVIESTAYFVCLEGVSNSRKHAPAAKIAVTVRDTYGGLEFVVADTGPGFASSMPHGGLYHLATRVAAVGGTMTVHSAPGEGTSVRTFIPF